MTKNFILKLNYKIGNLYFRLFGSKEGYILCLLFHTFTETHNKNNSHIMQQGNIDINSFEKIIKFLLDDNFIFLSQKDIIRSDLVHTKKYVVITIDDGYFNNFLILDIIKKYNIPITLFVNSYNIINNKKYWWDIVYFYEKNKNKKNSEILRKINKFMDLPFSERNELLIKNYGKNCAIPLSDVDRPMNISELKKFSSENLVTIGNHLKYHSTINSQSMINFLKEFQDCEDDLFNYLNYRTNSFAYPNGFFSEEHNTQIFKKKYKLIYIGKNKLSKIDNSECKILSRYSFRQEIDFIDQITTFITSVDPIYLIKKILNN